MLVMIPQAECGFICLYQHLDASFHDIELHSLAGSRKTLQDKEKLILLVDYKQCPSLGFCIIGTPILLPGTQGGLFQS
jgi:hypothetical protein